MWVKHDVKGVRDVTKIVGEAAIEAGVAVACDEHGKVSETPKPAPKATNTKKKGS